MDYKVPMELPVDVILGLSTFRSTQPREHVLQQGPVTPGEIRTDSTAHQIKFICNESIYIK